MRAPRPCTCWQHLRPYRNRGRHVCFCMVFVPGEGKAYLTLAHAFSRFWELFSLLHRFPIHLVQEAYSRMVLLRTPGRFVPWPEAKWPRPWRMLCTEGRRRLTFFFPVGRGTGLVKLYTYLLLNAFLCLVCRMALLVQVTDGQSDISVAMAKAIGMLPADAVPRYSHPLPYGRIELVLLTLSCKYGLTWIKVSGC